MNQGQLQAQLGLGAWWWCEDLLSSTTQLYVLPCSPSATQVNILPAQPPPVEVGTSLPSKHLCPLGLEISVLSHMLDPCLWLGGCPLTPWIGTPTSEPPPPPIRGSSLPAGPLGQPGGTVGGWRGAHLGCLLEGFPGEVALGGILSGQMAAVLPPSLPLPGGQSSTGVLPPLGRTWQGLDVPSPGFAWVLPRL